MLYMRFIICLGAGLFGLALVMMTLMDALLQDWDVVAEIKKAFTDFQRRHRHGFLIIENRDERQGRLGTRIGGAADEDRRRRALAKEFLASPVSSIGASPAPSLKRYEIVAPS